MEAPAAISRHIRSSTSLARGVRPRLSERDSASVIGFHDTSRCCAGGFAKLVARDVENGEAPTLLWERLKIRLDENLDRLFTGMNLDTNGRIAKVNFVASSVLSSNDDVGHYRLALRTAGADRDRRGRHPESHCHRSRTLSHRSDSSD